MAINQNIQRTLTINTNAQQANQQLTTTQQLLVQINQSLQQQNQISQQQTQAINNSTSGLKKMRDGFKGVGLAIKALGIGLLLEALNIVKDLFSSNQTIVDGFSTAIKALNIVFNDLFTFISDNVGTVVDFFKQIFENPRQALKDFGDAIKENLIERFNSFIDTLGYLAKGVGELFRGNFKKAGEEFKKAGKESIDVFTGVNNTVDKVVEGTEKLIEKGKEYLGTVIDTAAAMVKLENQAKIAEARNKRLIEQYDRQAEQLRQVRDDEALSIQDRITANEKLSKVLNNQEKAMRANAAMVVQQAKNAYALNRTIENQVKLIEAQAEADGILAQIEGFRSEQLVNRVSLQKELNELNKIAIDSTNERTKIEKEFAAEQIKDDTDRLTAQRENLKAEYDAETKRLTDQRELYKEGTVAYEEANQELLNKQQEINNKILTNQKQLDDTLRTEKNAALTRQISDDTLLFETRLQLLTEQLDIINQTEYASEEAKTAALKANSDQRKSIIAAELEFRNTVANQELDIAESAISLFAQLGEKNKAIQKATVIAENAAGIARIIINTMAANAKAVAASPLTSGQPFVTLNNVQAGISVAASVAATAKALSAMGGGSAGSSAGTALNTGSKAPSFNVVGVSGENQLAETVASQQGQVPVAQVVAYQVTTQQALDRQIINNATFI